MTQQHKTLEMEKADMMRRADSMTPEQLKKAIDLARLLSAPPPPPKVKVIVYNEKTLPF